MKNIPSNTYGVAKWIVDPSSIFGTHTTIASALSSASSGDTIFIRPGTYTENLTLISGVNVTAFACDAYTPNVTIIGKITMSAAGTSSISGINIQTNSDFGIVVSGTNASILNLINCFLTISNNTFLSYTCANTSSGVNFYECNSNITTTGIAVFTSSGTGNLVFNNCLMQNTGQSLTNSSSSAGTVKFQQSIFRSAVTITGGNINASSSSQFDTAAINITALTTSTAGLHTFYNSTLSAGSATAIVIGASTMVQLYSCVIGSTNAAAISGAGTLSYSGISFSRAGSIITASIQKPLVFSNNAVQITTPGSYPYTTVPQDAEILVDTSSARTIVPLASPSTGQKHIIKDKVGSAASNNITVTPSGNNIDGSASFVMNNNYQSIDIVYDGSQWSIV